MSTSNLSITAPAKIAPQSASAAPATVMTVLGSPRIQTSLIWYILIVCTIMVVVLAILRVLAKPLGLEGVLGEDIVPVNAGSGSVDTLLAPFVTVALAVERLLETAFDQYEQQTRNVSKLLANAGKATGWVVADYQLASGSLTQAISQVKTDTPLDDPLVANLNKARTVFVEAETRLDNWLNGPDYVAKKRAISIWVGLLIGVLVSSFSGLQMLHTLGIQAPLLVDILVTGLLIGAGPGPMHSLIGILQASKEALDGIGSATKGKTMNEVVDAVQKAVQIAGPAPGGDQARAFDHL